MLRGRGKKREHNNARDNNTHRTTPQPQENKEIELDQHVFGYKKNNDGRIILHPRRTRRMYI